MSTSSKEVRDSFRADARLESIATWSTVLASAMFATSILTMASIFPVQSAPVQGVPGQSASAVSYRVVGAAFELAMAVSVFRLSRAVRAILRAEEIGSTHLKSCFHKLLFHFMFQVVPLYLVILVTLCDFTRKVILHH